MISELKVEDLLPLIMKLSLGERQRLLRLILKQGLSEAQGYAVMKGLSGTASLFHFCSPSCCVSLKEVEAPY